MIYAITSIFASDLFDFHQSTTLLRSREIQFDFDHWLQVLNRSQVMS